MEERANTGTCFNAYAIGEENSGSRKGISCFRYSCHHNHCNPIL